MVLVVAGAIRVMNLSGPLELIVAAMIGMLTYLAICRVAKLEALNYLLTMIRRSH